MSSNFDFPISQAKSLSAKLFLEHPCQIPIEDIAWHLKLYIREVELDGCDGRLIRKGHSGIISINKNIQELGRRRWTIAHEIGHFLLHGHKNPIDLYCDDKFILNYGSSSIEEAEANCFAAELLLPSELMHAKTTTQPGLDLAAIIAKDFQVTLTAATMRIVDLAKVPCAVIFSQNLKMKWFKRSSSFSAYINRDVTDASYAYDLSAEKTYQTKRGKVFTETWLSGKSLNPNAQIIEESVFFPKYNSVLTILYADSEIMHEAHTTDYFRESDPDEDWREQRRAAGDE